MPSQLLEGLRTFRRDFFPRYQAHYERLVREGQQPHTLFIGCADSRLVPHLLTNSGPGELFVLRNVGALVPIFEPDEGYHGTSAGIEFAIFSLRVNEIVVCGHSDCGAMRALYQEPHPSVHVRRWLALAEAARLPGEPTEETLRRTEQRSLVLQLQNLLTYPMVRERVESGQLALHAWHYLIDTGEVLGLDVDSGVFSPLV